MCCYRDQIWTKVIYSYNFLLYMDEICHSNMRLWPGKVEGWERLSDQKGREDVLRAHCKVPSEKRKFSRIVFSFLLWHQFRFQRYWPGFERRGVKRALRWRRPRKSRAEYFNKFNCLVNSLEILRVQFLCNIFEGIKDTNPNRVVHFNKYAVESAWLWYSWGTNRREGYKYGHLT